MRQTEHICFFEICRKLKRKVKPSYKQRILKQNLFYASCETIPLTPEAAPHKTIGKNY